MKNIENKSWLSKLRFMITAESKGKKLSVFVTKRLEFIESREY